MLIDTEAMVSMSEASGNFSEVARLVDERGAVVVSKNNAPRYIIMDYAVATGEQPAPDDKVTEVSERLIVKNLSAYEELA